MKILILGSDGFVGSSIKENLKINHEVYGASRNSGDDRTFQIDLKNKDSIIQLLTSLQPDIIVNAAGIVENSEKAEDNVVFTTNLLEAVIAVGLRPKRIIISGSAAEYGIVDEENIPVNEEAPLNATAGYGLSKKNEVASALEFADKHSLPITVARIFNPIGAGMKPRFLINKLIDQVEEFKKGSRTSVEVNRLDAKRDYLNIKDVAEAVRLLIEDNPAEQVYNIGSGVATTTRQLIETILNVYNLKTRPTFVETSDTEEPLVAIQADISRLKNELDWSPKYSLEETVKEVVNATRQ